MCRYVSVYTERGREINILIWWVCWGFGARVGSLVGGLMDGLHIVNLNSHSVGTTVVW